MNSHVLADVALLIVPSSPETSAQDVANR